MKTLLIIDANSLIHRAYHALPPFTSPTGQPTGGLYGLSNIILKILNEKKPDYIVAAFDRPEPTFRDEIYKEYKGTRAKAEDDLISQIIGSREIFNVLNIKFFDAIGYEADDIIMTIARKFASIEDLKITLLSGDLDLIQAVLEEKIILETPKKGVSDTALYDEKAVFDRFGIKPNQMPDYKGLVGDTSDNIPGVSGIGPKTAADLIRKYGTLEEMYKEIDELGMSNAKLQKKLEEGRESAILSKKLATLKTDVPIDVTLELIKAGPINKESAVKHFESLGFESLVKRLYN